MHPLVVAPLLEVPSAEDTATDGSMAYHFDSPPSGIGHCGKRGLCWAIAGHARCNTYILLLTDRFSRRADMFAVTAAEFIAKGTANILTNQYIPLWGCPRSILSDNGLQVFSKLSHVVYMSSLVFEKSPPAPTIQAATMVWSALTTQWPKCWLWSSTNAKTIGMRSCRTWSSPTTIRSLPPQAWPPTRFTWAGSRTSLSLFSIDPGSPAIRTWPATTSHTATWCQDANSTPMILFARCMP